MEEVEVEEADDGAGGGARGARWRAVAPRDASACLLGHSHHGLIVLVEEKPQDRRLGSARLGSGFGMSATGVLAPSKRLSVSRGGVRAVEERGESCVWTGLLRVQRQGWRREGCRGSGQEPSAVR